MGRLVRFSVVDDAGQAVAGKTIIAGGAEVTTGSTGIAQVLLDDGDTVVTMNGTEVYRGPAEALRPMEILSPKGARKNLT